MYMSDIEKHMKLSLKQALIKYLPEKEGEKIIEIVSALVI
jgi:hypothetical protein